MTRTLRVLVAAVAIAASAVAQPGTADARCFGCGFGAGFVGGALLAGAFRPWGPYYGYGYAPAYYGPPYAYGYAYSYPPPYYGYRPAYGYRAAYLGPRCVVRRTRVMTPYGWRPRAIRMCR